MFAEDFLFNQAWGEQQYALVTSIARQSIAEGDPHYEADHEYTLEWRVTRVEGKRNRNHWIVKGQGSHAEFAGSTQGYVKAARLFLSMQRPKLMDLITISLEKNPIRGLEARLLKAAHILDSGCLSLTKKEDNVVAQVVSMTDMLKGEEIPKVYSITLSWDQSTSCNCPDFLGERAPMIKGQQLCKHILTWHLYIKTEDAYAIPAAPSKPKKLRPTVTHQAHRGQQITRHGPNQEPQPNLKVEELEVFIYKDGKPADADLIGSFQSFVTIHKDAPRNQRELVDWRFK